MKTHELFEAFPPPPDHPDIGVQPIYAVRVVVRKWKQAKRDVTRLSYASLKGQYVHSPTAKAEGRIDISDVENIKTHSKELIRLALTYLNKKGIMEIPNRKRRGRGRKGYTKSSYTYQYDLKGAGLVGEMYVFDFPLPPERFFSVHIDLEVDPKLVRREQLMMKRQKEQGDFEQL